MSLLPSIPVIQCFGVSSIVLSSSGPEFFGRTRPQRFPASSVACEPLPQGRVRIAVCFYGIVRSLSSTISSIRSNVIQPARGVGDLRVFAHLFDQTTISNPRSGEFGILETGQHSLLCADRIELERPGVQESRLERLKSLARVDPWGDGFRSLNNLLHQLYSLGRVQQMASEWGADVFVFVRPDLRYLDSFSSVLDQAAQEASRPVVFYPSWQLHGGLNDRFAVVCGSTAARAYSNRGKSLETLLASASRFNGERLLRFALFQARVKLVPFYVRAERVRLGGRVVVESFRRCTVSPLSRSSIRLYVGSAASSVREFLSL